MAEILEQNSKKQHNLEVILPQARIRSVMKSSLDTGQITNEVLYATTKAAELFIQHLAKEANKKVSNGNTLKYEHLAQYVQEQDNFEFLLQIIPQKIKVSEFKALLQQAGESGDSSESGEN